MTRPLARLMAVAALLTGACISELVVEVQPSRTDAGDGADAAPDEEDAGWVEVPDSGPIEIPDGGPVGIGPAEDARASDAEAPPARQDGGTPDAALDAGPIVVLEAGTDAGCKGAQCDSGVIPGPCPGGCDIATLTAPACDGGGHQVCWNNPDNTCTVQCPPVARCSPTQPCADDEWCFFENNDCGDSVPFGYCAKRRPSCGDSDWGGVCGCDGMSYMNPCFANQAGTAVRAGAVCK